jgi:hypothetical protein
MKNVSNLVYENPGKVMLGVGVIGIMLAALTNDAFAALVAGVILLQFNDWLEVRKLQMECWRLNSEIRTRRQATNDNLSAGETQLLFSLIAFTENNEEDNFERSWDIASDKVMIAYNYWRDTERKRNPYATHSPTNK